MVHWFFFLNPVLICSFIHSLKISVTSALRSFSAKRDTRLPNNDDKVLSGQTAEQCADACEKETSFPCRSFDYDKNGSTCYLSRATSGDIDLTSVKGFDYYEMSELLFYLVLFAFLWILFDYTALSINIIVTKFQVYAARSKGIVGRSRGLLHVLNTDEI